MGKGKLAKFAEMETFKNVFQYPFSVVDKVPFDMQGQWRLRYFRNNNPIVLELGWPCQSFSKQKFHWR